MPYNIFFLHYIFKSQIKFKAKKGHKLLYAKLFRVFVRKDY